MILLTTSRRPTRRIRAVCHDVTHSLPNIVRINRGKMSLDGIAERAVELNADRVVVIDRWKGGSGKIKLFRIESTGLISVPPLMFVAGVRLQREFQLKAKYVRSLVVTTDPENLPESVRVAERLSDFFQLPNLPIDKVAARYRVSMHISLDASRRIQITFMLFPQMVEIGPRITLSRLMWEVPT